MRFPVPPLPPTFCYILVVLLFCFQSPRRRRYMTVRETEENIEQIFPELSNLIDIINKWLSHGNIDPELAHFIIYLLDYLTTTHKSI
ncbi:hypothetical protein DMH20_27735 [Escherichia coli]|nr:hypothetical protein [Escherichia coli]